MEPWKIFHEEFCRAVNPGGSNNLDGAKLKEAIHTAREATAHHLTDMFTLHPDEATKVVERFTDVMTSNDSEDWKEKLKHAWTDWDLRRPH